LVTVSAIPAPAVIGRNVVVRRQGSGRKMKCNIIRWRGFSRASGPAALNFQSGADRVRTRKLPLRRPFNVFRQNFFENRRREIPRFFRPSRQHIVIRDSPRFVAESPQALFQRADCRVNRARESAVDHARCRRKPRAIAPVFFEVSAIRRRASHRVFGPFFRPKCERRRWCSWTGFPIFLFPSNLFWRKTEVRVAPYRP